ncbi:methionyl-tRNA formyltransferase [Rhodoblastus acidophilus]|uniref:Methionyl-tRNA formyltransferase n=1 Tax=Candidatus Rhodoblastus alkanivorans TaxID=2954117 RepID=A0ABS9ZBS8_9HYPH|nr:methionyl-tRNA formyltransferase [Candidatus Rhodoblastus alkanivorans]MCI4679385.1 methionyl-tRNA formyltransferase [Candidatus Rhodoblastus alkanivorans]MCI4684861.1 methionyl-tRNA formyltransferase [Candidatus Rhodoblastus alkanivorans]MDI4642185.1 methionyl-tRNA formyltransferase [Rhodoblastus acidophilus]
MRVIFMGTPDFALAPLAEIFGRGHEIAAVYTRAPKPAGRRGLELTPSPVHAAAEKYGLRVLTPRNFREPETIEEFRSFDVDVAVVVAYGLILPRPALEAPKFGCLNLHASLLPRWRGAAPIQRAIMAGDRETGVEVMQMEEGLDTGPIAMAEKLTITPEMTAGEAHDRLSALGADLIGRALAALERGGLQFQPQSEEGVLYARKIDKAEARVDFNRSAGELHNLIRGLSPFPGAFFEADFGRGPERVKIMRAAPAVGAGKPGEVLDETPRVACGDGAIRLLEIQRAGRSVVSGEEFFRGARLTVGDVLVQAQHAAL